MRDTNEAPTYKEITDGSQFRKTFWNEELQSLQNALRRQSVGQTRRPSRRIPTADELQIQFVMWLLDRPELPMLVSPASSGFYDEVYGTHKPTTQKPTPSGTGFFDDEYVGGKRIYNAPNVRDTLTTTLNPANRDSPSYNDVCTAELTTATDIERHETRIYQPGYTPKALRDNILHMLRHSNPDLHMVDFQEKDIPPPNRDPHTHRLLTDIHAY